MERPIVPDGSGSVRQGSLSRQASAAERSSRRLTTHQQAVLIQVLLAFPEETVAVRYLTSASDALNYANDFSTIFKAVNWNVVPAEPAEDLPHSSGGLTIVVRGETLPASAEALRDALRIYGIEAQVARDQSNLCGTSNFALAVTKS
jgi:hypothetical protein